MKRNTPGVALRGFTLVELLVVIAIISILAAILFPVYTQAKAAAKSTTCLSNIRNIGLAAQLYSADSDDLVPACADPIDKFTNKFTGTVYESEIQSYPLVNVALQPYARSQQIFKCPADMGTDVADLTFPYAFSTRPSMFAKYGVSYGWNVELSVKKYSFSSIPSPANVGLSSDGSGSWHTGQPLVNSSNIDDFYLDSLRYNTVFTDLHAKNLVHSALVDANAEIH